MRCFVPLVCLFAAACGSSASGPASASLATEPTSGSSGAATSIAIPTTSVASPTTDAAIANGAATVAATSTVGVGVGVESAASGLDPTHLPLGNGQFASSPTVGKIYSCRTDYSGGTVVQWPWYNGDGTWDSTAKPSVAGDVRWDAASVEFVVSGDWRVITANALPTHGTGVFPISPSDPAYQYDRNPGTISAQSISQRLPANPTVASEASCIRGEIGIAIDGVPIFDGFDADGRDAPANELQDACHGHPQRTGVYHYHNLSPCLDDAATGHSALIGYAYDGFGIYGPRGEGGETLINADLDECHGHTHEIVWDGTQVEMYHYHATAEFPYTVGCLRGTSAQGRPIGG